MSILYLDCSMGAAGDMLTAALLELLPDQDAFLTEINALGIPGVQITRESVVKCGIRGTHISVSVHGEEEEISDAHKHSHHHHYSPHNSLRDIEHIIGHLHVAEPVRNNILAVYRLIAQAESHVHGIPVSDIHFHEVGTMDAIADITAVCLLLDKLSVQEIVVSPIHVGSGQVRCAHGILPVPAPATAYILRDVPIYGGKIRGELCTPTGAALLKHFANRFDEMPLMRTKAIGYGMGKKDFEAANCVRAILGERDEKRDLVYELSCNVDDMTAERIAFATERLFQSGALDVYTIPIGMKKSRPGSLLHVLCREEQKEDLVHTLFKHTTTIGVRETAVRRYVLDRKVLTLDTPYGKVQRKDSIGYGVTRSKYEYECLSRIAVEQNLSIEEVEHMLNSAL